MRTAIVHHSPDTGKHAFCAREGSQGHMRRLENDLLSDQSGRGGVREGSVRREMGKEISVNPQELGHKLGRTDHILPVFTRNPHVDLHDKCGGRVPSSTKEVHKDAHDLPNGRRDQEVSVPVSTRDFQKVDDAAAEFGVDLRAINDIL
jgi:hypothetical protein